MISILIADDHQLIRDTWVLILNKDKRFEVIGTCNNSSDAVSMTRKLKPNILLLDINMPPFNGIEATRKIRAFAPNTGIIAVTMSNQPAYVKSMFQLGALGYVTKNSSIEEMMDAILTVSLGNSFLCEEMKGMILKSEQNTKKFSAVQSLTSREIEVVHWITAGLSSKEICKKMAISLKTVESHRHNILKKIRVKNAASLIHVMKETVIHV
jgi:DNA-binding NarL/FixJ family response regulator